MAQITKNPAVSEFQTGLSAYKLLIKIRNKKSAYEQVIQTNDDFARDMTQVSANIMRIADYQIKEASSFYTMNKVKYDAAVV